MSLVREREREGRKRLNSGATSYRFVITSILFVILLLGIMGAQVPVVKARELHVGPDQTYSTIQAAINNASDGDTIIVHAGTYPETLVIDKSLTIRGDPGDASPGPGVNAPILDGSTLGNHKTAVRVSEGVSNVIFEGFEIRNYGTDTSTDNCGVSAWNTGTFNVQIRDNYIHDVGYDGILTGNGWGGSQGLHSGWIITRNIIKKFGAYAIDLENAKDSQITNNVISDPKQTTTMGVVVAALSTSATSISMSNIIVSGNQFIDYPDRAIQIMAWVDSGASGSATLDNVKITGNTITDAFTAVTAWTLAASGTTGTPSLRNVEITGNTITFNNPKATGYGFHLENVGGINTFSDNIITFTGTMGGGVSFFHAVDIRGSSTGTWTIKRNELNGNNLGSLNCGFRLRNTLPATVSLTFECNDITKFARGIRSDALPSGARVEVNFNNIFGNTEYGISNDAGAVIDAKYNWWGSATGPTHSSNLGGTGDKVSDYVDFTPWLGGESTTETVTNQVLDAKSTADTEVNVSGTATVTVAKYAGNPGGTPSFIALGKYVDVSIEDPSGVSEVTIRVYYTEADLTGHIESEMRLWWWDSNTSSWVECSDSGVTYPAGGPTYRGYIWARIRGDTTPSLGQLTGTPFGGGNPNRGMLRLWQPGTAVQTTIYLNGVARDDWGLNWVKLPEGSYTLAFSDVPGWKAPTQVRVLVYRYGSLTPESDETVTLPGPIPVYANKVTEVRAQFTQLGYLHVITDPPVPGTIYVDGVPINDWGCWCPLEPGSHTVTFGDVPGYTKPEAQVVTVISGTTVTITVTYTPTSPP